jgi:hypothetical protein
MKTIILIILLSASACYAKKTPIIAYDPNAVTESLVDPNNITITIQVEISKDQYAAMQYLNISLIDVVARSRLSRTLDRLIEEAKRKLTQILTVTELKAKVEKQE